MPDGSDLEYLRMLEEQDKRAARKSFLAYYRRMSGFQPEPHHRAICKVLQGIEDDLIDRAMIFMPRRMGKSFLCTQLFPSWVMGRHPKEKLMSAVHTQKYAAKTGKIVRNHLRSSLYPFETTLSGDSQAKDQWATGEGGEYNGFGLMGGSTHGNPAGFLISDDLIKGRKMALSDHMREEAWETYKADLVSSLQDRKKQLLVTTRWHQDDIAGKILPENYGGKSGWYRDRETGEPWYVLSLPAAAEEDDPLGRKPGEWLWPSQFGDKFAAARKRGGYLWSALYQQRPSPEEGLMFTRDHIQRYNPADLDLTCCEIYGSSDYAVSTEAGSPDPDYTVHMVWAVDPELNIYLLDMWRGRTESDQWVKHFIRLAKKYKPLRWGEEAGQILKSVGPMIRALMQQERVFVNRVQLQSSTSKEQRAQTLLGWASMGKFYLPHRTMISQAFLEHMDAFETELLQFPTGRHDDTVDAATLFARMLDRIVAGQPVGDKPGAGSPHGNTLDDLWSAHDAEVQRRKRDQDW